MHFSLVMWKILADKDKRCSSVQQSLYLYIRIFCSPETSLYVASKNCNTIQKDEVLSAYFRQCKIGIKPILGFGINNNNPI